MCEVVESLWPAVCVFMGMVAAAKQEEAQAEREVKQSEMQLGHCQKELMEKQQEMGQTAADYQKDTKNLEKMEREHAGMEGW